jgi:hypothetical protein
MPQTAVVITVTIPALAIAQSFKQVFKKVNW